MLLSNEQSTLRSKRLQQLIDKYIDTLPEKPDQSVTDPFKTLAVLLHVFYEIQHSSDRIQALNEFWNIAIDDHITQELYTFFASHGLPKTPDNGYTTSLKTVIQDVLLSNLVPGVDFTVWVNYFQAARFPAIFHTISVYVTGFHVFEGDEWTITPEANKYKLAKEHFSAMNESLMMFFNYPFHSMNYESGYLDDYEDEARFAMERQVQAILQSAYIMEYGQDQEWQAFSPLAGLLESAYALRFAGSHLSTQKLLDRLKMYLKSPVFGNVHQTLTEYLQQIAHSHPEHYRIALNRMLRELFRQHFLIEMDDQFQVTVLMPDEQGRYKVKVDAPIFTKLKKQHALTDKHLKALTWMLESIFNYAEELELPNNVWRREVMA